MRKAGSAGLMAATLLLGSCASTNVAPLTTTNPAIEADERELLRQVRDQEQALVHGGFVATLPEVDDYLNGVLAKLHPQPLPEGFQLHARVIADPTLNAFVLPNGAMFVHSGLLARLENEAQLAAVLSHELTHAVYRHGLKSYRSMKNHSAFASAMYIGGGGSVFTVLTSLGALSSAMGYSRDLEREADVLGFKLLVDAGYSPLASGQVFRLLMEESTRAKQKEPFFFGSHPRLSERSASFRELAEALPPGRRESGKIGEEEFAAVLPGALLLNAQAAMQKGDLEFARESAEHARRLRPTDAQAVCALAETYRRQSSPADREAATRYYREALALDATLPAAQRGLGLELMKAGDHEGAAEAFRRYLKYAPDAGDRAHIQEFIRQCENKS